MTIFSGSPLSPSLLSLPRGNWISTRTVQSHHNWGYYCQVGVYLYTIHTFTVNKLKLELRLGEHSERMVCLLSTVCFLSQNPTNPNQTSIPTWIWTPPNTQPTRQEFPHRSGEMTGQCEFTLSWISILDHLGEQQLTVIFRQLPYAILVKWWDPPILTLLI